MLAFQGSFAEAAASRPPHLSAIVGSGSGPAPVVLNITDPQGRRLGPRAWMARVQSVPYGGFFTLAEDAPRFSQMALIAVPPPGQYTVEVIGTASGSFDLGLVVPEGMQLRHLTFAGVEIAAGQRASVVVVVGAENTYVLAIDYNGDGVADQELAPTSSELVVDRGPVPLTAVQIFTGDNDISQYGQAVGVLFDEEIDSAAYEDLEPQQIAGYYQPEANEALGVAVQPGGRVVFLYLRDGIGPFVPRTITVANVADRLGHPMAPISAVMPISPTIPSPGGTVSAPCGRLTARQSLCPGSLLRAEAGRGG